MDYRFFKKMSLFSLICISIVQNSATQSPLPLFKEGLDLAYEFWGLYRPELFYGKNISLLNDDNPADQIWYMRSIIDYSSRVIYGQEQYCHPAAELIFTVRNKSIWGNLSSIGSTSESEIKVLDAVGSPHKHFLPRHFFWMREGFLRLSLNDMLKLKTSNEHTLTLGSFPFELGRAISLGSAFAVGTEFLGFYSDTAVDQYAFGIKLSGEIVKKKLIYGLYYSILDTKTSSLSDTNANIRGQEFGRLENAARGFGRVNYLVAGHLFWYPLSEKDKNKLIIEPYALYNHQPEQKVEFKADAESHLGTFGLAVDLIAPRWEAGIEGALNAGHQDVRGIDRNVIKEQNRNGFLGFVNSHVLINVDPKNENAPENLDPYKVPHSPQVVAAGVVTTLGKDAQALINSSNEKEEFNGAFLGTVPGLTSAVDYIPDPVAGGVIDGLYNASNRYRNSYRNLYKGWMLVGDASVWYWDKDLRLSVEAGVASGDDNPNFATQDGVYSGFIGLEELYSGRRVRSAFVLGAAGKLQRPLSQPGKHLVQSPSRFAQTVSGFTNLIYGGASALWVPEAYDQRISINPNILLFGQEYAMPKFNLETKKDCAEKARKFLGTELNLFAYYFFFKNLKLFFVGSVFVPGGHYTDIKGKPLNSEQVKFLNRQDKTGSNSSRVPNISDDTAITLNIGFEFRF